MTEVSGCTNAIADNYNAEANNDDGSCIISGCTNTIADNYNADANTDDGSCIISGCTNTIADNYNAEANNDDGSCIISGCTNTIADNYNADANTDDGSCIISGCTNAIADNYNADANTDDGSCIISGCTNTIADNYNADANTDDGSCIISGCTNTIADNYNADANTDDGSCIISGCTNAIADNYNAEANNDNGSCIISGCTDELACNYNLDANIDNGSCEYIQIEFDIVENLCPDSQSGSILTSVVHGTPPYTYSWNNGANSSNLSSLASGQYFVTVTDSLGCSNQDSVTLHDPNYSIDSIFPEICYVSVDDTSGSNKIKIKPIQLENIYGYSIFKEVLSDEYVQIGTIDASTDEFTDINSNPMMNSSRYRIKAVDFCSNSSNYSEYHQSIHLSINLGFNNSINLSWSHYLGFEVSSYMVYRGYDHQNLEFIAFVSGNQNTYTDINPPAETSVYQIRLITPICTPIEYNPTANMALNEDTLKSNFVTHNDIQSFGINIISNNPSCFTCEDGSIIALPYGGTSPYSIFWSNNTDSFYNTNLGIGTYTLYATDNLGNIITETITLNFDGIAGCTDASADNYDPTATDDDGSCTYCNNYSLNIINISNT